MLNCSLVPRSCEDTEVLFLSVSVSPWLGMEIAAVDLLFYFSKHFEGLIKILRHIT